MYTYASIQALYIIKLKVHEEREKNFKQLKLKQTNSFQNSMEDNGLHLLLFQQKKLITDI